MIIDTDQELRRVEGKGSCDGPERIRHFLTLNNKERWSSCYTFHKSASSEEKRINTQVLPDDSSSWPISPSSFSVTSTKEQKEISLAPRIQPPKRRALLSKRQLSAMNVRLADKARAGIAAAVAKTQQSSRVVVAMDIDHGSIKPHLTVLSPVENVVRVGMGTGVSG
jgi:hypothetical protein